MEVFRCVFIFLVVFLSAVKVQSTRNVSIYCDKKLCKGDGRYLRIDCSATETSINNSTRCNARADGPTKEKAESRFQLVESGLGSRKICIQFTNRSSGEKYALKVVNQSRVVFERYQGCNVTRFKEFRFVQELREEGDHRYFRYKPVDNPSMCLGKVNSTLSLVKGGTDKVPQRLCLFQLQFIEDRKRG